MSLFYRLVFAHLRHHQSKSANRSATTRANTSALYMVTKDTQKSFPFFLLFFVQVFYVASSVLFAYKHSDESCVCGAAQQ
jgi:hypothetical protein